jgi:hypothetical protein
MSISLINNICIGMFLMEAGQLGPLPTRPTFETSLPTIIGQLAPLSFGQLAPP